MLHPSVPAQSVKELVALAKAKPGQLNYGSAGNGSVGHFSTEQFKALAGVDLVHIPYKGAGPAVTDLVGGRLQLMFENLPTILPARADGETQDARGRHADPLGAGARIPDDPESGVPGYESSTAFGVLAPAKTPGRRRRAAQPGDREDPAQCRRQGTAWRPWDWKRSAGLPRNTPQHLKEELAKYGRIVKAAGIKLD